MLNKKLSNGFTLIELMVVLSIISFLATLAITNMRTANAKGRDAVRLDNVDTLNKAAELYYSDHGYYPSVGSSCFSGITSYATCFNNFYSILSSEGYVSTSMMQDPLYNPANPEEWSYTYQQSTNNSTPQSYIIKVEFEVRATLAQAPASYTGCWPSGCDDLDDNITCIYNPTSPFTHNEECPSGDSGPPASPF